MMSSPPPLLMMIDIYTLKMPQAHERLESSPKPKPSKVLQVGPAHQLRWALPGSAVLTPLGLARVGRKESDSERKGGDDERKGARSVAGEILAAAGDGDDRGRLAGLACMFSTSILLQILACALYNNWWPMLAALMYILVPMPCLFFGDGSTRFLTTGEGGAWINAAKFLTGASAMGSLAIPAILRHAGLIETGAMFIEFTSFFILVCTVMCFHRATLDEDW
ncbi:vacuolar protein sorting-associated protein 55 homolog isoform X1 [Brachypodium distachyon]|nr:vacuolar protein sorting-associated protein 55 homolog isoform X1 [Brachypodium distachyon]|eukprot:XP_003565146.2 vacuolar protein sorting-associated protein 55 homolog isoform X1 [Brachypodium distachyon]